MACDGGRWADARVVSVTPHDSISSVHNCRIPISLPISISCRYRLLSLMVHIFLSRSVYMSPRRMLRSCQPLDQHTHQTKTGAAGFGMFPENKSRIWIVSTMDLPLSPMTNFTPYSAPNVLGLMHKTWKELFLPAICIESTCPH